MHSFITRQMSLPSMGVSVCNGRFDGSLPARFRAAVRVGCRLLGMAALRLAAAFDPGVLVPQVCTAVRRLNTVSGRATS
jgi:hypothetical protein